MSDTDETKPKPGTFNFDKYPENTLIHDRREGRERRDELEKPASPEAKAPSERRAKKERRRRIDPTTFEKQYTDDELEFMNAMQRFKVQSGKSFPTHGEVLKIAVELGYRRLVIDEDGDPDDFVVEEPETEVPGFLH